MARIVLLAHDGFPDYAKTAVGLLRYSKHDVRAVIDRSKAGKWVNDFLPGVQDAPIVQGIDEVQDTDTVVVGVAPIGGGFNEEWRGEIIDALEQGFNVWSGLHYYLGDDPEFSRVAERNDCSIWDVRKPPDDLGVAEGLASDVGAEVVLTVGTDCSVGKMTTTAELVNGARELGLDAAFAATGQTGIMIEGEGIAVDAVKADYAAGAVERLVQECKDNDVVFVEGQGSLLHPAYSGVTTALLHGSAPSKLVLCHEHNRSSIRGYNVEIPPLEEYIDIYEQLAAPVCPAEVVAGSLDTSGLTLEEAREAVEEFSRHVATATDPVRFGVEEVLDTLL